MKINKAKNYISCIKMRSAIGLLCSSAAFTINATSATSYIVNGTDTNISTYPSIASIFTFINFDDGSYEVGIRCGATIIDATYILTAAHCVSKQNTGEMQRLFTVVLPQLNNQNDFDSVAEFNNTTKYWVDAIYVHEGYNPNTIVNDIAVLRLETPMSVPSSAYANFVANENQYRESTDQVYTAVGHGNTQTGRDKSTALQMTNLSIVENSACGYRHGGAPSTQLCMQGQVSDGLENATCIGDSGGPLYWTSGTTYQVGITSYGPGGEYDCGSILFPGATSVFTEVVDYIPWIDAVRNGLISPQYSPTESARNYFRQNKTLPPSSIGPSSGGGIIRCWSVTLLIYLLFLRLNPRKSLRSDIR